MPISTTGRCDGREWIFDSESHICQWISGPVIPCLTAILEAVGLVDYSHVPRSTLELAKQRGTYVHEWSQLFDTVPRSEFETQIQSLAEAAREEEARGLPEKRRMNCQVLSGVVAYTRFRRETGFEAHLIEHRGVRVVEGLAFSFQLDRTGTAGGRDYLLELKTPVAPSKSWAVQTAAQMLGLNDGRTYERRALLLKRTGTYRLIVHPHDKQDTETFLWALRTVYREELIPGIGRAAGLQVIWRNPNKTIQETAAL